jgi:hypothetical protein
MFGGVALSFLGAAEALVLVLVDQSLDHFQTPSWKFTVIKIVIAHQNIGINKAT